MTYEWGGVSEKIYDNRFDGGTFLILSITELHKAIMDGSVLLAMCFVRAGLRTTAPRWPLKQRAVVGAALATFKYLRTYGALARHHALW